MKQRIVMKVPMKDHKCRSKALKIAIGSSGVESVALRGQTKEEVEVMGHGIDSVELTRRMWKKLGCAVQLVSVGEVMEVEPAAALPPQAVPMGPLFIGPAPLDISIKGGTHMRHTVTNTILEYFN